MLQKAVDKLFRTYRSRFYPIFIAAIAIGKADLALVMGYDAMIRDGHAMRIATKIIQQLAWPRKWWLGIDHPRLSPQATYLDRADS